MPSAPTRVKTLLRQLQPLPVAAEDVDLDQLAYGFMASQALFAALELNIFDRLAQEPLTVEDLSKACGMPVNRLQTLLTALVASKCLRICEKKYSNSPNVSKFMVSSSKAYYGDYLKYQIGRLFYSRMGQLVPVLRGEETLDYSEWFSDPEVASSYTQAQHNGSLATARALFKRISLKGVRQMLDVGGGSGAFSLQATKLEPDLRAIVLELPEVCATGRALVQSRVRFVELNATEPEWPSEVTREPQDLVLMSYLCGSVPEEVIEQLYRLAFKALRPQGRLVVHDFMVDDSKDRDKGLFKKTSRSTEV